MSTALMITVIVIVTAVVGVGGYLAIRPYQRLALSEHMSEITYGAAFLWVTEGLEHSDIYTRKGNVRSKISKKSVFLQERFEESCSGCEEEFRDVLYKQSLLTEQGEYRRKDQSMIASAYLDFAKTKKAELDAERDADMLKKGIKVETFELRAAEVKDDIPGVYILLNKEKRKYYVGQSKRIYGRVRQHLSGHGNGDVYADLKNGDPFFVRLIPLENSNYPDLDSLEKHYIQVYSMKQDGTLSGSYNKTAGNN